MFASTVTQQFHAARRQASRGFTLIEVLVVVTIIGILARIAYPAYVDYSVRGKIPQATSNLAALQTKMEQWFQDQRSYQNGADCGGAPMASMPVSTYFTFTCQAADATHFTLRATGATGGLTAGFVYTVDQDGIRKTTGAPTGWALSDSCWVTKKDGSC